MARPPVLIGFDAGGTKTVLRCRSGEVETRFAGPGTNLKRDGLEECADRLLDLIATAVRDLPEEGRLFVCGGVAGAGRAEERGRLESALREGVASLVPVSDVEVLHDGELALESALPGERSGLVCIAGTGSIVLARTAEGAVLRAGGWGSRVDGDPGSGMALGRAAVAAVAADFDGGPRTILRRRLEEVLGITDPDELINTVNAVGFDAATLAPVVIEAAERGDPVAEQIVGREAAALAERAGWLAARAEDAGGVAHHIALGGGLVKAGNYRDRLISVVGDYLPGWTIVRSELPPEEAALVRAARLADQVRLAGEPRPR